VLADLSGREVEIPDAAEHVATGACVQAAAVLGGHSIEAVLEHWQTGRGTTIAPEAIDRDTVRDQYRAARG
jgi:xylulokinase